MSFSLREVALKYESLCPPAKFSLTLPVGVYVCGRVQMVSMVGVVAALLSPLVMTIGFLSGRGLGKEVHSG